MSRKGPKLSGELNGDKLEGTVRQDAIHFVALSEQNCRFEVQGTVAGGVLTGTLVATDATHPDHPYTFSLTANPAPLLQHHAPQRHDFTPTGFYRQLSALNKPVLKVAPGDTIHTTTIDAGGTDEKGIRRAARANPQIRPFYIEGAMPGDVLAVPIDKLRLHRDWASSDDSLVDRSLGSGLAVQRKDVGKEVRWHLDLGSVTASPEKPSEHLAHFRIPLKPMLGCIAVTTSISGAAPGTGDSGYFGGNMGLDGSLDEAFKEATSDMAAWLAADYKLTPSEIAQAIGVGAEYGVSEAADRNAGVILKLSKRSLQPLALLAK